MFQHLIVPVDGSPASLDAVRVASRMASAVDGHFDVVTVVHGSEDHHAAETALSLGVDRCRPMPLEPLQRVVAGGSIASVIAGMVDTTPGATVLMSSHGHGRSAAVLGSNTDEVLREIFGPVIVIGPHCDVEHAGALSGTYVVPLDGSPTADSVLPIVAAWAVEFGGTPWLVGVVDDSLVQAGDVVESAYVGRRAGDVRQRIDRPVEYETLHGSHPARSIVEYAENEGASLIFLATHGRTGFSRLRSGSVAAEVVRRAHCPVVLFRPPELSRAHQPAAGEEQTESPDEAPEWSRAREERASVS